LNGRRRGVVVGVNNCAGDTAIPVLEFAEADAVALRDLLVDDTIGTFDADDVTLLLGPAATTVGVKRALRTAVLASEPSDVLLVYFAGHGLLPSWQPSGDPYLLTSDVSPTELPIEPDQGLAMSFMREHVFEASVCSSFLVLDCCHAGGYLGGARGSGDARALQYALTQMYERYQNRHSALLACPRNAVTRERTSLRHGVFTHHLLAGLGGAAAGVNGDVTFEGLASYVGGQDLDPPPGLFVRGWGKTVVLTRPGRPVPHGHQDPAGSLAPVTPPMEIVACSSPLDSFVQPLERLMDRLFRPEHGRLWRDVPDGRLEGAVDLVRNAVEAEAAVVVDFSPAVRRIHETSGLFDLHQMDDLLRQVGEKIIAQRRDALGHIATEDGRRQILAVPLAYEPKKNVRALLLLNPARSFLDLGEPLSAVLNAVWKTATVPSSLQAEIDVLTALRKNFGRLPLRIYRNCFDLYRTLLGNVTMVFEPVVQLSERAANIGVFSWEALARLDETALTAPNELLNVPNIWGDRFFIERDSVLAVKAINSYTEAHANSAFGHDAPKPLSINVAVRSLMSDAYADAVGAAIAEAGLAPRNVTLEISERDPIMPSTDEDWPPTPLEHFDRRLAALGRKLGISFAMDDFGIGHSSLDWLANLTLTQIKVDRTILHHRLALAELELVVQVADDTAHQGGPRVVVVEGFDETSPVSLADILARRIQYVQGYITEEPASVHLRPFNDALRERIASLVRGER